jgi:hypothetical protein
MWLLLLVVVVVVRLWTATIPQTGAAGNAPTVSSDTVAQRGTPTVVIVVITITKDV